MAKRNYLVEGLSGVGKSSVYEELVRRGYTAISTDRAWSYSADPDIAPCHRRARAGQAERGGDGDTFGAEGPLASWN